MSFDRSDSAADEPADLGQPGERPGDRTPDTADGRRPERGGETSGPEGRLPALPTAEERIEAHWRTRQAADAMYGAADSGEGDGNADVKADSVTRRNTLDSPAKAEDREGADGVPRTVDTPSPLEEALLKRVAELEADKAARDKQFEAQERQIAEQAKAIAELRSSKAEQDDRMEHTDAYLGQVTTVIRDLQQSLGEARPSAELARRARGGEAEQAEWKEPEPKRRLPSDAWNNVIQVAAGGTLTALAYQVSELPPEVAGIGATAAALGAGIIAVLRERKKGHDDADH
jgi:uncharacterized coiled-coil protein SlyX